MSEFEIKVKKSLNCLLNQWLHEFRFIVAIIVFQSLTLKENN